jgi:ATP-dependent Clp protease protease subunit
MRSTGSFIPFVIEKTGRGERSFDIYSRLLEERIVFIGEPVTDHLANVVIAQLLFLQKENKTQDINVYINSPGGYVTAGLAIYDTMQFVQPDVATYCIGQASSMAAILLSAGAKGKRFALPHAQVLVHQPMGGARGTAADIEIHAEEILRKRDVLNRLLSKHTGQPIEQVAKDTDRDYFMTADEARAYGLVDEVVSTLKSEKK